MKQAVPLTQRVVAALAGTVLFCVVVLVVFAYFTFDRMEDDLVNDIVNTETDSLLGQIRANRATLVDGVFDLPGAQMRAWVLSDSDDVNNVPYPLLGLPDGLHELEPEGETWHVRVTESPVGRIAVLYDATENEKRVSDFGLIVLGLGVICVIIAYGLARRVARFAVAPILQLTERLTKWAPGSPDMDITSADEAGRLIEAFNRVQNQVDHSIAREREFATNLSHEVRTPLTAMRTDSELMLLGVDLTDDQRQRLQRIVENVDAVASALEGARALAADERRTLEVVNLAQCLDDAWRGLAANAHVAGLTLENAISPALERELDRHALLTVLRNLIRNAIEHASPATLTVTASTEALILHDNGRGIAAEDVPFVFERYYSGRRHDVRPENGQIDLPVRRGLGLAIAKRVCDMQGWALSVKSSANVPGSGSTFTLRFDSSI